MKYLKYLTESKMDGIIDEIESIKYILEDEGYQVKIEKDNLDIHRMNSPYMNPWTRDRNIIYVSIYYTSSKLKEKLGPSLEQYVEFVDRLCDIARPNYRVSIVAADAIKLVGWNIKDIS